MVDRIAPTLAKADGKELAADPARYRHLALAALRPLAAPSEAMIDAAAHQAVWFDAGWAIKNNRRDFRRAVRAMFAHAIDEAADPATQTPIMQRMRHTIQRSAAKSTTQGTSE